jgi:hypothetical protein
MVGYAHDALIKPMKKISLHFVFCFLLLLGAGCAKFRTRSTHQQPVASVSLGNSQDKNPAIAEAAAKPVSLLPGGGWQRLFNGHDLTGWKEAKFAGRGEIKYEEGLLVLKAGDPFTGLNWTNEFPEANYEITLEAMRLSGSDFFCGLTVPVGTNFCSLIVGGWGGSLFGISSIDGMDASENETTKFQNFDNSRWYRIRFLVTLSRLQVWIDQEMAIDADITGKRISVRAGDIEMSEPLGISCWMTSAAFRDIQWRRVTGPEAKKKKSR